MKKNALSVVALLFAMVVVANAQSLKAYTVFTSIGDIVFNRTTISNIMGPIQRYVQLNEALSDAGVGISATASAGTVGISRTAGTSLILAGELTASNAKTDKALWVLVLPDSFIAGSNIPVTVNASVAGAGTLTGVSTTMTVAAYTETNGVEAVLTVSAAQPIVAAGSNLVFTITGTAALVPGQVIAVELTMLVTTSSGGNTGNINSVSWNG